MSYGAVLLVVLTHKQGIQGDLCRVLAAKMSRKLVILLEVVALKSFNYLKNVLKIYFV